MIELIPLVVFPTLLTAVLLALFNMARGEGKLPHWAWLILAAFITQSIPAMWIIFVVTILPIQSLFSATHGNPPNRGDGRWEFLQDATFYLMHRFVPHKNLVHWWQAYGMVYGAIRGSLALPAIVWLGSPVLLLVMLQGVFLKVLNPYCGRYTVRVVEGIMGIVIGMGV